MTSRNGGIALQQSDYVSPSHPTRSSPGKYLCNHNELKSALDSVNHLSTCVFACTPHLHSGSFIPRRGRGADRTPYILAVLPNSSSPFKGIGCHHFPYQVNLACFPCQLLFSTCFSGCQHLLCRCGMDKGEHNIVYVPVPPYLHIYMRRTDRIYIS